MEPLNNTQLFDRLHVVLPAFRSRSCAPYGCALLRAPRGRLRRRRCINGTSRRPRSARRSSRCCSRPLSSLSAKPPKLPQQTGTRTIFQAWQPRASPQANKHVEAGATMGRPIPRPRSHPRRSISATQPQDRGRCRESMERYAATLILSLERIDSLLFPPSLCN
jgi:hypothetical protein